MCTYYQTLNFTIQVQLKRNLINNSQILTQSFAMNHQRKRFNYLSIQQRALNSSNVLQNEKTTKPGSIMSSNTKPSIVRKQQPSYASYSRNSSSVKKTIQPLSELTENIIFSSSKQQSVTRKNRTVTSSQTLVTNNKENITTVVRPSTKDMQKLSTFSQNLPSTSSHLESRITQLQTQNSLLLQQTEEKFVQMETHLERVQKILKEKQSTIESLSERNNILSEENQGLKREKDLFRDKKEELLRIIGEKNEEIKRFEKKSEKFVQREADLMQQLNAYAEELKTFKNSQQPKLSYNDLQIQTQPTSEPQTSTTPSQTDLHLTQIQALTQKDQQPQQPQINYRQKYESLFKKALQMEDEIYKLKEDLFDSQNEVKTLQQEFNTYKIFNQIDKINGNQNVM